MISSKQYEELKKSLQFICSRENPILIMQGSWKGSPNNGRFAFYLDRNIPVEELPDSIHQCLLFLFYSMMKVKFTKKMIQYSLDCAEEEYLAEEN